MAQPQIHPTQVNPVIPVKRNVIINGNFNIWQRGTVFAGISTTIYTADRFLIQLTTQGTWTIQQIADAPADQQLTSCLEALVTTADGPPAAPDVAQIVYHIEGFDFLRLYRTLFVISFWVKSNLPGPYYFAVDNNVDRGYVIPYTIDVANTWEYKTLFVTSLPTGGTWNFINGAGVSLRWVLALGSNFHTTLFNQWITNAGPDSGSDQVNLAASINNYLRITGVQVEVGSVATPFEVRPFSEELALCQRYYEKSYNVGTAPGSSTQVGARNAQTGPNGELGYSTEFKTYKRVTPTATIYNSFTGATGSAMDDLSNTATAFTNDVGEASFGTQVVVLQLAANRRAFFHWTAEAEL